MGKRIGTSWTNVAYYRFNPGTGFICDFYLDARYSTDKQSIDKNESYIYTKLRSVVVKGYGSVYGYDFRCTYAPNRSGSDLWTFATEDITSSGKTPIKHEADGTKSIYLEALCKATPVGLNKTFGGWVDLDTIPRATKLSNQTGVVEEPFTISWSKASSNFRHKLYFSFGSISNQLLGENLVDNYRWTPPESLYQYFKNSPSASGTLKLETYSGSTLIGTAQTATLTLKSNENNCRAVVSSSSVIDSNGTTTALTGNNNVLVLRQSNALIKLGFTTKKYSSAKAVYINGSSISLGSFGKNVKGSNTEYYGEINLGKASSGNFDITIVDSREYRAYKTITNNTINYVQLDTVAKAKRIQPTTGDVGLQFSGNYYNGSFGKVSNDLTIRYKYKKQSEEAYSNIITLQKDTDYKISGNKYNSGTSGISSVIQIPAKFDYKSIYEVIFYVNDKLITLPEIKLLVVKGIPIYWWNGNQVVVNGNLYVADEDGNNKRDVQNVAVSPTEPSKDKEIWYKTSKNLFDKNHIIENKSLNPNTGEVQDEVGWIVSNYIPVKPNEYYTTSGRHDGWSRFYYDKNKKYINRMGFQPSATFQVPNDNNICYMRFENSIGQLDKIQCEEGKIATPYTKYINTETYINSGNSFEHFNIANDILKPWLNPNYLYTNEYSILGIKLGEYVIIHFRNIAFTKSVPNYTDIMTGLPKSEKYTVFCLFGNNIASGKAIRLAITTDGAIRTHWSEDQASGDSANKQYGGFLMYKTTE